MTKLVTACNYSIGLEMVNHHDFVSSTANDILVATVTAFKLNPNMSFAATDVVHPEVVFEWMALPVASAGRAAAVMVLATVGNVVPVATFHISIVQVGLEPSAVIFHPVMVPAYGTVMYPF